MKDKVTIFFPFIEDGPSGGGNNFLKALRKQFIIMNVWTDNIDEAKYIFFNSHQYADQIIKLKALYPTHTFIHRVDGPMSIYNKHNDSRDKIVRILNFHIAEASIYQSQWSLDKCKELKLSSSNQNTIIHNAPDSELFFKNKTYPQIKNKIKIISSGWSDNPNKGSDTLLWLDQNLDFDQFEMSYIGNSNIRFKNIKSLGKVDPSQMGNILRENDIYFFPSIYEACSNALLEGIHCGLIPLARNSSSNIEIVTHSELLFDHINEVPKMLKYIKANHEEIRTKIKLKSISEVAKNYYAFATSLSFPSQQRSKFYTIKLKLLILKLLNKIGL